MRFDTPVAELHPLQELALEQERQRSEPYSQPSIITSRAPSEDDSIRSYESVGGAISDRTDRSRSRERIRPRSASRRGT